MAKRNKEKLKSRKNDERKREVESKPGFGDKKLEGPNTPAE